MFDQRLRDSGDRRDDALKLRVRSAVKDSERVSKNRDLVKYEQRIHAESGRKALVFAMEGATARRKVVLGGIVQKARKAFSNLDGITAARLARETQLEKDAAMLIEGTAKATARREQHLASRKRAAEKDIKRVAEVRRKDGSRSPTKDYALQLHNQLDSATKRRDIYLSATTRFAEKDIERVAEVRRRDGSRSPKKDCALQLRNKLKEAAKRRDVYLSGTTLFAKKDIEHVAKVCATKATKKVNNT